MALRYTTTKQLGDIIGITKDVPSWDVGATPANEVVGTGNNSDTSFYLDQKNIVLNSYTIYANAIAMTEVTDYSLDKTTGEITLTAGGVTALGTDTLTAKYSYFALNLSDSYLQTVLERAETKVDNEVNSTFTDGTATNPTYTLETEIQPSQGFFMDRVIVYKKPLIDVETTLDGAITDSDTTISLASGTGSNYPSSGKVIIDSEVISYTGVSTDDLTGCTRAEDSTTAAAHLDTAPVHSTIFFRSNTLEGSANVFVVQPWDTSMFANSEGLIYEYRDNTPATSTAPGKMTSADVANRLKILYYYGYNTIPEDIVRLSLIFAKEMLMKDTMAKSLIAGRDEFNPTVLSSDMGESERIIGNYIVIPQGNT